MSSEDLFEKVKGIIVEQLGVTEASVTKDASFIDDLGSDSLDIVDLIMALEEEFDTEGLDVSSREFLDSCIDDYNKMFNTNYDSSSKGFQNYYKDLSQKVKDREVDLLIVVNMFLTGFDATTLNTLWVDKNLKQHGLI